MGRFYPLKTWFSCENIYVLASAYKQFVTIIAKIDDISNDNIFRPLFAFIEVFPQHKCGILRNHILELSVVAEHIFFTHEIHKLSVVSEH